MTNLRYFSREEGAWQELCRREALHVMVEALRVHFGERTIREVSILTVQNTLRPSCKKQFHPSLLSAMSC